MNYTLDSVKHFVEALGSGEAKGRIVRKEPILINDLTELKLHKDNVFYFGVLTVGDTAENCALSVNEAEYIRVKSNSQIIDYFQNIEFYDVDDIELIGAVKGHFRGFQVRIE